jgi:iron complex outermembrane recepter protein
MRRYTVQRGIAAGLGIALSAWLNSAEAQTIQDLQQMSISQLEDLDVMSVTKTPESLSDAPGAIYVITSDDIARSGYKTVPEILRLAPNLQVIEIGAGHYVVTARGLSGNISAQAFANKLLVLIDGRSVYTPLFSGVYWDSQDVVAADIDRIEVISGPGATLWGANAVNGVINIITRKASQTQGGLLDISAGNLSQSATLRYGGRIDDTLAYRFYVSDYNGSDTQTRSGANPHDHWQKPQAGFRFDWDADPNDAVTFQGDYYTAWKSQVSGRNEDIEGHNLLARWEHQGADGSSLEAAAYYDHVRRADLGGGWFWQDTYNLDVQHSFSLGDSHRITWGGNYRSTVYAIHGTTSLYYAPGGRTLDLADAFAQDSITLSPDITAVLGLKLEDDPYSGLSVLPSGRLSWKIDGETMVWAAVSRAIRSPTPFDHDVQERVANLIALYGDGDFEVENLTAYELGTRIQLDTRMSVSLSAYYNRYDNLRTIELTTGAATLLNLTWGNNLRGETHGFDLWGEYRLTDWWRLSASLSELVEHFNFRPGASGIVGVSQLGDDPEQTATLRSSMNLSPSVSLDLGLRYVAELPNPRVPAFVEGDASIGWSVSDDLRLSLSGYNLLHAKHYEFPPSDATAVPRSFTVGLQWRF